MNTKQRIDELEAKLIGELEKQKKRVTEAIAGARLQLAASKPAYDGIARSVKEARYVLLARGEVIENDDDLDHDIEEIVGQGNAFTSTSAAERELKTRQLIYDAKLAMLDDWGDVKCDWSDLSYYKCCIDIAKGVIHCGVHKFIYKFLAFRTAEARDAFRNSHTDEELILIITNGMGL